SKPGQIPPDPVQTRAQPTRPGPNQGKSHLTRSKPRQIPPDPVQTRENPT
ncbi:hypothetical protein KM043_010427, partial [Ampulex compressa]